MRKTTRKKMLLLPIILLLTISALNVSMPSVSATVSPYVAVIPTSIVDNTLTPGNTFTVSIDTDYTGSDIWGYQFTLSFNPSVIQGVEVLNGDIITNDTFPPFPPPPARFSDGEFDNTLGRLSLTVGYFDQIPPPTVSGPGTLATVTFSVVGTGTSDITLGEETQLKAPSYDIINALLMPDHIGHGFFDNVGTGPVNDPPVADFTWSPTTPEVNGTVDFDAQGSYDPDGVIVSYEWDFGDDNTGTGLEVMHAYMAVGTYTVTLTVTDDLGATDTATATIEVIPPVPPLQMDLIKWKAKPEHKHFDISKDEDAYCDLIAYVRNGYAVDKDVTVEFIIINKATTEVEIVSTLATVPAGTDALVTCSDWIPTPGTYSISVTGTFDLGTTSTKVTRVGVVP